MEFRKSTPADIDEMMQIVNDAKLLLKKQNINQWQTGYPNRPLLEKDIADGIGYVLCEGSRITGSTYQPGSNSFQSLQNRHNHGTIAMTAKKAVTRQRDDETGNNAA